jgi:hypothetical protein
MLSEIPQSRWQPGTGDQNILKSDFRKLESAIIQVFQLLSSLGLVWVNVTTVKVPAVPNSPAQVMLCGFPDVLHPGAWLTGGITDGIYRANTSPVSCVLGSSGQQWGNLKPSNWYAILAIAASGATAFTLKAMPYLRFMSQVPNTGWPNQWMISLGTNLNPANGIGYGFVTNELVGGQIYVLTGPSAGLMVPVEWNNNDNGTGGLINYYNASGSPLTLNQGDWFIVLPPTNFNRLADVYSNTSSQITRVDDFIFGKWPYVFIPVDNNPNASTYTFPDPWFAPLAVSQILETGIGGGGMGQIISLEDGGLNFNIPGLGGSCDIDYPLTVSPGSPYTITIGLGGSPNRSPGTTSLGSLRSLSGGGGVGPGGFGNYGGGALGVAPAGNGILILEVVK